MSNSNADDAGLKDLAGLKELQSLTVANFRINGTGLTDLPALENLNLEGCHITDEGMKSLAELKKLNLMADPTSSSKPITAEGLKALAELDQLQELILFRIKITDTGMKHLAGLKQLR